MTLVQLVRSDLAAWGRVWNSGPSARYLFHYCGMRATFLYRVSHFLWQKRVPLLPGFLFRLNITLHGFDVPPTVDIGPGLYVPHPVGTVISADKIGANVTLISSITIGMRGVGEFPTLEDGVFVGAGVPFLSQKAPRGHVFLPSRAWRKYRPPLCMS